MSTNKTPHLNLHAWEPEDNFSRVEFNENFQKLDTAAKTQAETGAKMQQQLDTRGNCNVGTTTYTGNGESGPEKPNTLTFPGAVKAIFIGGDGFTATCVGGSDALVAHSSGYSDFSKVSWSNGGKTMQWFAKHPAVQMNTTGKLYHVTYLY